MGNEIGSIKIPSVTTSKGRILEKCYCVWTIKNFSKLDFRQKMRSPVFRSGNTSKYAWALSLHPGAESSDKLFDLLLWSESALTYPVNVQYSLSVPTLNEFIIKFQHSDHTFSKANSSLLLQKDMNSESISKIVVQDTVEILIEISRIADELAKFYEVDSGSSNFVEANLANSFLSMFVDEKFHDVTILVAGQEIKAHRCVLSARSPVFSAILSHDKFKENVSGKIEIADFTAKIMYALLKFMYCGKLCVSDVNMALDLIRAANKYELEDLKLTCGDYLTLNTDVSNVEEILLVADATSAENLKKSAMDYVIKNPDKFSSLDHFKNIETKNPRLMTELLFEKMSKKSDL